MPRLFSSRIIIKILEENGFIFIKQRGSHRKYRKLHGTDTLTVIVPADKKEIPTGTFKSILRQSKLQRGDFEK